jgi:hypothetical protein
MAATSSQRGDSLSRYSDSHETSLKNIKRIASGETDIQIDNFAHFIAAPMLVSLGLTLENAQQ